MKNVNHVCADVWVSRKTSMANQKQSSSSGSSIYHLSLAFHSKLKSHLFKNSYPDSSDPPSSKSRPKWHSPWTATLPLLEIRPELTLDYTLWTTPLICRSAREQAGTLRFAFKRRFGSLKITITFTIKSSCSVVDRLLRGQAHIRKPNWYKLAYCNPLGETK